MFEVKVVYNLLDECLDFIRGRRRKLNLPQTNVFETVNLLNQEKNGCVLFTWDDATESSKGSIVTHVGIFDPTSHKHELIWTYNQRIDIVSCSINQDKSLLAFTTKVKDASSSKKRDIYSAYVAEIQANITRVFSLNLERSQFLKVQFLYNNHSSPKECHMVIFLHRESIGLYNFHLGCVGDKGVVMRDQPNKTQLTKKFYWCHWDCLNQRLYYLHYQKIGRKKDNSEIQPVLSCLQFYDHGLSDFVLDVPINFPFPILKTGRQNYTSMPLHNGIPDPFLNMTVLTQKNGTFCLCYHHLTETPYSVDRPRSSSRSSSSQRSRRSPLQPSPASLTLSLSSENEEDVQEINYYICMVHHAKILHGQVIGIPSSRKHRLHFSWIGDDLLVVLPGHFVHVLNVCLEYEPCHHILLQDKSLVLHTSVEIISTDSPDKTSMKDSPPVTATSLNPVSLLSQASESLYLSNTGIHEMHRDAPKDVCIFDFRHGQVLKVQINTQNLINLFMMTPLSSTRLAIFHYVLTRIRDFLLITQLFTIINRDLANPEWLNLMAEFLTGTTYSSMKRQVDQAVLKFLPFTVTDTFRGQIDKDSSGNLLAKVSYLTLSSVKIGTKTAQERSKQSKSGDDMWDSLRMHLQYMQLADKQQTPRFSQRQVTQMVKKDMPKEVEKDVSKEKSFLSSFHTKLKSSRSESPSLLLYDGRRQRPDTVLGTTPLFLQGTELTEISEQSSNLTKDLLMGLLSKQLKREYKGKTSSTAKDYVYWQVQQSRQLCHLLWSMRGHDLNHKENDLVPNLYEPSCEEEYELFQLTERYYMTCLNYSFPVLQGFTTFFTAIAYRCLPESIFFQYIDRGVLSVSSDFVAQVLLDLTDEKEKNVRFKHRIISLLPKTIGEECFKQWDHPSCRKYLAQKQVFEVFQAAFAQDRTTVFPTLAREDSISESSFQPLNCYLNMLEKLDNISQKNNEVKLNPLDLDALENIALFHTKAETHYDLSTANF